MGSVARDQDGIRGTTALRTPPRGSFQAWFQQGKLLRKRFYILFVARDDDGQLRKIPIPVHYLYVFAVGAAIGILSLTGIASSYSRMLLKVSRYNQLRTEKEELKTRYTQ